jgi:cyclase
VASRSTGDILLAKDWYKLRVIVLAALVAAPAVAYLHGQTFGQKPAALTMLSVTDDLYVIHNDIAPGNATALLTDDGVLLIDDKFAVDHENIISALKRITDQPVRYVVNTHHHADHTGGNLKMLQLHIPVIASDEARRNMTGTPRDGMFIDTQPGFPTITVKERTTIHLGGQVAELYHFGRGHTDGDLVVYLPRQRTIVTGDLFTFGAETPQLIDYAGGGSAKAWTRTLDDVLRLEFDTVIPGHGVVATRDDLRTFRDTTARLSSRVHEMVMQKQSRGEISRMLETEFGWIPFLIDRALDGLIAEHQ